MRAGECVRTGYAAASSFGHLARLLLLLLLLPLLRLSLMTRAVLLQKERCEPP